MTEKPTRPAGSQGTNSAMTFVHADPTTFREIVQRLTGPLNQPAPSSPPASPKSTGVRSAGFKLHERRRQVSRTKLKIANPNLLLEAAESGCIDCSSFSPGAVSPSASSYGLSSLMSPSRDLAKLASLVLNKEEEEKAITARRFYLHPSPRFEMKIQEPQLLPLFPLTSPNSTES